MTAKVRFKPSKWAPGEGIDVIMARRYLHHALDELKHVYTTNPEHQAKYKEAKQYAKRAAQLLDVVLSELDEDTKELRAYWNAEEHDE